MSWGCWGCRLKWTFSFHLDQVGWCLISRCPSPHPTVPLLCLSILFKPCIPNPLTPSLCFFPWILIYLYCVWISHPNQYHANASDLRNSIAVVPSLFLIRLFSPAQNSPTTHRPERQEGVSMSWRIMTITSTRMISILTFILTISKLISALSEQTPFSLETDGKPKEMLQVGRLPALGCTSPFAPPGTIN